MCTAQITTNLPDHVREEAEVETSTHSCQDDECQCKVSANLGDPDGVEWVG